MKLKKNLKPYLKMDKKIKLDENEIEKFRFHQQKSPALINNIGINEIVVSNKFPFGKQNFKYYIGYRDSERIRYLCIFRPQMIIYKRNFDENRRIYFLMKEENVFIKYMEILEQVSNIIKSEINTELTYGKKYLKAEIKKHKTRLSMLLCINSTDILNL